ncbi:MAG: S9 family peptidase [Nonomuraea sp.]|nr:S9 family peptidase [Nonomuraea sp.]
MSDSLPRQHARTRGFGLGVPHAFTISPDGDRVLFLRSRDGGDPLTCLWELDVETGRERLVAEPGEAAEDLPREELVRRERTREKSTGVTAYTTDRDAARAVFALSGRLHLAEIATGQVRELPSATPAVAPHLSPDGSAVAYVSGGALRVLDPAGDRALAAPETPTITYGLPEHVAAESMGRHRGFWWSPGGDRLLVARVDTAPVRRWYIANPAEPAEPPVEVAYPAAGTANAEVSLWLLDLDGGRVAVDCPFEYLTAVCWSGEEPLIVVQSRDQRQTRVLAVDPSSGATRQVREDGDACWVEIVPGVPALTASGLLVWTADTDGRRLLVDGAPVTPPSLYVREVLDVDGETVLFSASEEPTEIHLWTYASDTGVTRFTDAPGVHRGGLRGGTTVVSSQSLDHHGVQVTVHRGGKPVAAVASPAEVPVLVPRVELLRLGERELRTAVLLPAGHEPGSRRLPVLLDPYGGPAGQRVLRARGQYLISQWFADQGFAVVVIDGRGTPGRSPSWEKTIYGDRGTAVLDDQIAALRAAAARYPDLDLDRVGIRGWSFGGYLAALAVLRAPDVFHAAVAGAPVVDQRLYDTHWNERYLGHPDDDPGVYDRSGLLGDAQNLRRPLMLVHGLADDNVVAAHTLRLSAALTAAGRPHTVLPLPGITHMTPQEEIAENLLLLQSDFLKRALAEPRDRASS